MEKVVKFRLWLLLIVTVFCLQQAFAQYVHPPLKYDAAWKMHLSVHKCIASSPKALALMNEYDVNYYKLDVDVERTSTYISGNVIIQAKVTSSVLDTFAFELHQDLSIDSVLINQQKGNYVRVNSADVKVALAQPLNAGATVTAQIYYHGTPPSNASAAIGNGMNNQDSVTWSLSEPFAAYEWWPCKQSLKDKADSADIWITTDSTNKAGSNGLLTATVQLPDGKVRYEWKERYPIDYYLISVSVAHYMEYDTYAHPIGDPEPLLVQNYIYDDSTTFNYYKSVIDQTDTLLYLFSKLYGPYPFQKEKYGHCLAPIGGGMEHQTMTTLGYFSFIIVAHELSHQWFGDNVTCATWQDIMMNEGFATYSEYLALEYLQPGQEAVHMAAAHSDVMAQPDGAIYFTDTSDVSRIFSKRLTYDKGGSLIHMIRFALNDDSVFFNVLRTYQEKYRGKTASVMNFKSVLDSVSGMDFTDMFDEWFYGQGYPIFNIKWSQYNGNLYLQNLETASDSIVTPLFKLPVEYKIMREEGDTTIRLFQGQNDENYVIAMPGKVTGVVVDPNDWLVNGKGYNIHEIAATLFPNPCKNSFTLNLPKADVFQQLTVYDMQGKKVLQQSVNNTLVTVNTSTLIPGAYFVLLTDRSGAQRKLIQFVKQK